MKLPIPPSVNKIWRSNRGRVHRSKTYDIWVAQADAVAIEAGLLRTDVIAEKVSITITVARGKGFRRGRDLDNLIKPILDWSVRYGLLVDDDWEHVPDISIRMGDEEPLAYVRVRYERSLPS